MTSRRLLDPISRSLLEAADFIEKYGHCKNTLLDFEGRVCLFGAIHLVTGEWRNHFPEHSKRLAQHLGIRFRGFSSARNELVDWNNHPSRTADEVISALREAALIEVA